MSDYLFRFTHEDAGDDGVCFVKHDGSWDCPRCTSHNGEWDRWCYFCKWDRENGRETRPCPVCNHLNPDTGRPCEECGRDPRR